MGQKLGGGYGVFDMHGNVWEWCNDWYDSAYYGTSATSGPDPTGPSGGSSRVCRCGGCGDDAANCRSANRFWIDPSYGWFNFGFRLALSFV